MRSGLPDTASVPAHGSHVHPTDVLQSDWAAVRQQHTDDVVATAWLRRRHLQLRASQMRALRCLLTAEPHLAGH
jgi:hypothetical protein